MKLTNFARYGWLVAGMALAWTGAAQGAEYLVKFKSSEAAVAAFQAESIGGASVTDLHVPGQLAKVEMFAESQEATAKRLADLMARPDVEYVVENFQLKTFGIPNDPQFDSQWALAKVRASEAWDGGVGNRNVVVAVIDTGVDVTHPDLAANIWTNPDEIAGNGVDDDNNGLVDDVNGWDYLENDNTPNDATSAQNPGHGTHCAGIVGAVGDNGTGISGMSQQVAMMALRFIGPNGQGDLMAAIRSIDYAIAEKADIISASWGAAVATAQAQPLIEAVGRANDAGVIFVAAAANDGANNDSRDMYPANTDFPNVISVAASNSNDAKPQWSNFGKRKVHVASPGEGILSTLPGSQYGDLSGTSMATPLVAGLVALMKSQASAEVIENFNGPIAKALLQQSGAEVAIETACMCRVDAKAASDMLKNGDLFMAPAAKVYAVGETDQAQALGGQGPYTYASSDANIVEISAAGAINAKAIGSATLTVTDAAGATAQTRVIEVADAPPPGQDCPLGDPMLCLIMCQFQPDLPWCN